MPTPTTRPRSAASSTGSMTGTRGGCTGRSIIPASIIGISRRHRSLLTFPLNRMVGREFVPERGHGRVDDPRRRARRHVARRHERDGVQAARGAAAASRAWRRSSRRSASSANARLADAHPLPLPGAADRRAQAHAGADHHRDAAAARRASELPAEHQLAHRAGQRRRHRRVRDRGRTSSVPISIRSPSTRSGRSPAAQKRAEPHRGRRSA